MKFPVNFTWGAAAASYQIEGAAAEDGKGASVWDTMCLEPGRIWEGQSGAVACDHYHRYREDVAIMKGLGLKAYRLSVSWPRVLPEGTGKVNAKGLEFYDKLIDELLAAKIEPWITLFHWDYPQALYNRGGWLSPDSPDWFAHYTKVVVDRLSDRVTHWMTLNEPQCFIGLGHFDGKHAPGVKLSFDKVLLAAHHALLAHGKAVQTIRANAKKDAIVGWAPVGGVSIPASDKPEDIEAARRATLSVHNDSLWNNTWWGDPIMLGHYPDDGLLAYGKAVPEHTEADLRTMCQPLDFYGLNIYRGPTVRAGVGGAPETVKMPPGFPHTTYQWEVKPQSLYWGPKFLYEHYKCPIVVTENGMSNVDWVALDGKVHDPQRIDFLSRYISELGKAIADGVDARGYFQWSILDNFEWDEGYKQRFGLVHVDYATQKRTLKDSAHWYQQLIASNGGVL